MKHKKKIAFIIGARPNFIKIAPIFGFIGFYNNLQPILIHTGQHYDSNMNDVFFEDLRLPKPDYNLQVGSNTHSKQTAEIMLKLEDLIISLRPDLVCVVGDVNSTLAGALVSAKLNIKVAHIEAGLRSFNKEMPEEINRIVVDHLSELLFAPSEASMKNLELEGLKSKSYFSGDIMFDAVIRNLPIAEQKSNILSIYQLMNNRYIFMTLHRPYNVDNEKRLKEIIHYLSKIPYRIIFAVHPRTKKIIISNDIHISENIIVCEPVGYFDSLLLQKNAFRVVTDSGGIQKEAFFLKTPCITIRSETEWNETIEAGANKLLFEDLSKLEDIILSDFNPDYHFKPYGDGNAAIKILNLISE